MKKFIGCVVTFIAFLLSTGLATAQEKGSTGKNTSATAGTTNAQTRALIIGISKYKNSSLNLNYADKDAELFKNYLVKSKTVKEQDITLLLNEKATSKNIYQALINLSDSAKTGDTVYIYFSGNGDVQAEDGVNAGYLLGHDANSERVYTGTGGTLEMGRLLLKVLSMDRKRITVNLIIDAAYAGKVGSNNLSSLLTYSNLFLSCMEDQHTYEDKVLSHGYFTHNLVKGLIGLADKLPKDDKVTFSELNQFLLEQVSAATSNKQMPVIKSGADPMRAITLVKPELLPLVTGEPSKLIPNLQQK